MSKAAVERRFYTIEDLVEMGYGSRTTVWRRVKDGVFPAVKDGYRVLILADEFNDYIERNRIKAAK